MFQRPPLLAAVSIALLTGFAAAAAVKAAPAPITVERAWARPAPAGLPTSAAYFTVRNTGGAPDVLLSVSTPAASASLHESMTHGGMMMMQPVSGVPVDPGRVVELKPGGLHVMLEHLKSPLAPGARLPLTLRFKHAGVVAVTAEVRTAAP